MGRQYGVATPVNDALYAVLKPRANRIEAALRFRVGQPEQDVAAVLGVGADVLGPAAGVHGLRPTRGW